MRQLAFKYPAYLPNLSLNICGIIVLGVRSNEVYRIIIKTFGTAYCRIISFALLSFLHVGRVNLRPLFVRHFLFKW